MTSDPGSASSVKILHSKDGSRFLARFDKVQNRVVHEKVVDEDEYMKNLGDIIQRDFFPDLARMKGENLKPESHNNGEELPSRNPEGPKLPSLNTYLANNTTEDNASFSELMEEIEKKQAAKLSGFFRLQNKNTEAICSNSNLLSIESGISTQKDTLPGPKESITTRREITSSNAVHFIPDGAHLTKEELMQQIKNEQTINILNTRFKKPYAPSLDKKKLSAAKLAFRPGHFGPDGKLLSTPSASESLRMTPRNAADGLAFLDASPSPSFSSITATPLMTWGELDSTPARLDGLALGNQTPIAGSGSAGDVGNTLGRSGRLPIGAPVFRLPEASNRDELAHRLADQASRQRVKGRQQELAKRLQQSRLHSPRLANTSKLLSPAARRLLSSSTASLSRPSTLSRTGDTSRPGTGSLAVSLTPSHLLFSSSPLVRSALLPHPVIRPQVASCLADQSSSSIDDCADPLERFKPDSTTKTGASVSADSSEENGASNNVVLLPGLEFKEAKPNEGLSLTDNLLNLKRLD